MTTTHGTEVHREDGELAGFVDADADGGWRMRTVFGADLGTRADREEAVDHVAVHGLAVLADRWWFEGEEARIVEASPGRVVLIVGAMGTTPRTVELTRAEGLTRDRP